jgi:hypothetical protein
VESGGAGSGTADPAGTAGRLLQRLPKLTGSDPTRVDPARGGVIDVPDQFTAAEMTTAAATRDWRVAAAVGLDEPLGRVPVTTDPSAPLQRPVS